MGERTERRSKRIAAQKNKNMNYDYAELSFSKQLEAVGLKLRDIPGDGNCLFRALADQLEGNSYNHEKYREETVHFMKENRSDFEPFVEDNISFDRHVNNLRQLGTYAGNDAIVAFARNNGVDVVIHQLNAPMWTIKGVENGSTKQLHISYHNGDHYSSLRRIHDNSNGPANIRLSKKKDVEETNNKNLEVPPNMIEYVKSVCEESGCDDEKLVYRILKSVEYDLDKAMAMLSTDESLPATKDKNIPAVNNENIHPQNRRTSNNQSSSSLWDNDGTGTRIFGNHETTKTVKTTKRTNMSNKNRKDQNRRDRKKRSTEKKKHTTKSSDGSDDEISSNLSMLHI